MMHISDDVAFGMANWWNEVAPLKVSRHRIIPGGAEASYYA